jgi:hypothetical protein
MKIFLLMILFHIIDDFVFQPICLSKLKQKDWWKENIKDEDELEKYKDDYKAALLIHSLSWSIMIHLPLFLIANNFWLWLSVTMNMLIHCIVDDLKANDKKLNLVEDQFIHMIQILITFLLFTI